MAVLIGVATTFAQSQSITISGKIIDQSNNEPLPFATVVIKNNSDSSLLKGSVADIDGQFQITNVSPGSYYLEASFSGYLAITKDLFVGKLSEYLDVGTIGLSTDEQVLDEVIVEGERATVSAQLDKKS